MNINIKNEEEQSLIRTQEVLKNDNNHLYGNVLLIKLLSNFILPFSRLNFCTQCINEL